MDTTYAAFVATYGYLPAGVMRTDVNVSLTGLVLSHRAVSANLQFYNLRVEGLNLLLMANHAHASDQEASAWMRDHVRLGDIVRVVGHPAKTTLGELSVVPVWWYILTNSWYKNLLSFGIKVTRLSLSRIGDTGFWWSGIMSPLQGEERGFDSLKVHFFDALREKLNLSAPMVPSPWLLQRRKLSFPAPNFRFFFALYRIFPSYAVTYRVRPAASFFIASTNW
jgi:hypothetical protein